MSAFQFPKEACPKLLAQVVASLLPTDISEDKKTIEVKK